MRLILLLLIAALPLLPLLSFQIRPLIVAKYYAYSRDNGASSPIEITHN